MFLSNLEFYKLSGFQFVSLPAFDQICLGSLTEEILQHLILGLRLKKSQYYTVLLKKTMGKLAQN